MKIFAVNSCKTIILFVFFIYLGIQVNAQITSYPYLEDFETGPSGWTVEGDITSWTLGTPSAPIINSAASGTNSWVTNLNGNYVFDENGYVISPEFDLSSVLNPVVALDIWWNCENQYDGAVLQSSIDNQASWQNVGFIASGINWYNYAGIFSNPGGQSDGWSGRNSTGNGSGGWVTASHEMNSLGGQTSVYFRLVFASDEVYNDEGIGFDNFRVQNLNNTAIAIPDPEFEQALIDLGIDSDGVINAQVLDSDIYLVTELEIGNFVVDYDITSFEGLQFFQGLKKFIHYYNYSTTVNTIDFSGNLLLEEIEILAVPNLADVVITQNINLTSIILQTNGSLFDTIDVTQNVNLTELRVLSNAIMSLDITNNGLIEFLDVSFNPIDELVVQNLSELNRLQARYTNIEVLDLSFNDKLTFFQANNSALMEVDIQNGTNELITLLYLIDNPNLRCVFVDDVSYAIANSDWSIDPGASYADNSENPIVLTDSAQDLFVTYDGEGNQADVNDWLNDNGGAEVAGSSCDGVTWTYDITGDDLFDDTLTVFIDFMAVDEFSNEVTSSASLVFDGFAIAGESTGTGGFLCEVESYDLGTITGLNPGDPKFLNSNFVTRQSFGPEGANVSGLNVDFPDTGAGQFAYEFRVEVTTSLTIGVIEPLDYESEAFLTVNNVTIPFDPGPDKTVIICDFENVDLAILYTELDIAVDVDDSGFSFPPGPFSPEDYWFDMDDNPITEITEPGTYKFYPRAFLPDCGAETTEVTLIEGDPLSAGMDGTYELPTGQTLTEEILYDALQGDKDPGGTWSPTPAGADLYTYTHEATSTCPSTSAAVTVTEETLSTIENDLKFLKLYPNPTTDIIFLKGNFNTLQSVEIFSLTGQRLIRINEVIDTINIKSLETGIYFVKLNTLSASKTVKIIKK